MPSLFVLLLLVTAATTTASPTAEEGITHSFQRWMAVHGRSYSAEELPYRLSIYKNNVRSIKEFNTLSAAAGRTYVLGEGPYTDLTDHEFVQLLAPTRGSPPVSAASSLHHTHVITADEVAVPSSVDWRQAGAVTPVKQQGLCGTCF